MKLYEQTQKGQPITAGLSVESYRLGLTKMDNVVSLSKKWAGNLVVIKVYLIKFVLLGRQDVEGGNPRIAGLKQVSRSQSSPTRQPTLVR